MNKIITTVSLTIALNIFGTIAEASNNSLVGHCPKCNINGTWMCCSENSDKTP